jgi:phospholipase D1/2
MTDKQLSQIHTPDGKPVGPATSAPGWFIRSHEALPDFPKMTWGEPFSPQAPGNKVEFFTTGAQYFEAVEQAIASAKESIYITGWQINFDVELRKNGKTLYEALEAALDKNTQLKVYVMPWMSPKVGVDTGDFDTMLALAQLNAGIDKASKKNEPPRAFCLLAMGQTDMPGLLAIGFSHHQKLVVVDNHKAFVGGIDLAYGRRDDGRFLLEHDGRTGAELYNTCVPAMYEIPSRETHKYLTRWALFSSCFSGFRAGTGEFVMSGSNKYIGAMLDGIGWVSDNTKDGMAHVSNKIDQYEWNDWVKGKQQQVRDIVQDGAKRALDDADKRVNGKLRMLRDTGNAYAADAVTATLSWLHDATLNVPQDILQPTIDSIRTLTLVTQAQAQKKADQKDERYDKMKEVRKMLPAGGKHLDVNQPRMPWHDVQCAVTGPSVSDLSKNFVDRWNSTATRYEASGMQVANSQLVKTVFAAIGVSISNPPKIKRVPQVTPTRDKQPLAGKAWVQVLRSAPRVLLKHEAAATGGKPPGLAQNNCLKAMLTGIRSAQKFIYIEGQFFQSEYGAEHVNGIPDAYGPMQALIDITASPRYKKHIKGLKLEGVPPDQIIRRMDYTYLQSISDDDDFKHDFKHVLGNIGSIQASKAMGKEQARLLNPIGEALAKRIARAIADDLDFHVYLVVPVHPEGTLNTLNIMTQLHYTMQSLVFGSDSLINRIRRAIIAGRLCKSKKIKMTEALKIVSSYPLQEVIRQAKDSWKEYLTLLNLRNWTILEGKPVTEQIYVHSKLLIADDNVAILGSANINDRSQLGDRDSELAVIVRDDAQVLVKLDGVTVSKVSANVHDFRKRLWSKLFGLTDGAKHPATSLQNVIDFPAAASTWQAIQAVAHSNAVAYQNAFVHVPRVSGRPSSVWPTWSKDHKRMVYYMPFSELFWRDKEVRDEAFSWDAKAKAKDLSPAGVKGFIVELPTTWTEGENNLSGMNRTLLADNTTVPTQLDNANAAQTA